MQDWNIIDSYQKGMNMVVRFLGLIGGWIVNYPNGVFYILLVLGCIFLPYFALLTVVSLLCWSWTYGEYNG